jgi:glyoxylase-like metal-dependent hydrolase (beta-lactamase superfamily II)
MRTLHDRRSVLKGAVLLAAGSALAPLARAASKASATSLAKGLTLISGVGANVLALDVGDGVLLVDSGLASEAGALRSQLKGLAGGGRVKTLVNTHWHSQQTGSNEAFGKAGAQIIAHEKTKQRLSVDLYRPDIDRYVKALPVAGRPTKGFYVKETLQAGGETLELGYLLEAHTDGDCYVHFRNANVVAVGDAVSPDRDLVLDWYGGGWLGGRLDAIDALLTLGNDATRYVPAQGGVVTRTQLATERAFLDGAYSRMTELLRKGYSAKDMLDADVFRGLPRTLDDPQAFAKDAFKGLWAHHNTISHDIV